MTSVIAEVDPDDLSTVLFSYYAPTGSGNPGSLKTWAPVGGFFNLSAPGVSIDTSDRDGDGIPDLSFSYDEIVQTEFRMRAQATSYDNLRTGIGTLQRLLSQDGVVKWIPDGSSNTFYIYRKPSPIPALFGGRDGESYTVLKQFDTAQGLPITWNRERLLRGPVLLASVNVLRNGSMLGQMGSTAQNAPDLWNWDSVVGLTLAGYGANIHWVSTHSYSPSYRFTIATSATRNLQQTSDAASFAPGDIATFAFDVRCSGGSGCRTQAVLEFLDSGGASLGSVHAGTQTTLTAGADMVRLTATSSAAPASTDRVIVSLRFANTDATSYVVDVRRAQLEKAASASTFREGPITVSTTITNRNGKALFAYNPGDADAMTRVAVTAAGSEVAVLLARKAESPHVNLAETVNRMGSATTTYRGKFVVTDATLYGGTTGDTSSVAGIGGETGANTVRTTFTNVPGMVRRWRYGVTPTDPEALHGTWRIMAVVQGQADTVFRIRAHWQSANQDPLAVVGDTLTFDTTDMSAIAGATTYVALRLGTVTFDANNGDAALYIEGWAARDSGSGNIYWDSVYLVPADRDAGDQIVLLQSSGFRVGERAEEVWLGSELTTQIDGAASAASASGTKIVLDTVNQGVGNPPSIGVVRQAGYHTVRVRASLQENDGAVTTLGKLRVRKAPGPGATVATFATTTAYSVGDFVRPTNANRNGRTYRTTTAGTSGGAEPSWGTADGGTTTSGTAVFTETTVSSRSLISKSGLTSTRRTTSVRFTADGTTAYEFVVVFTASTLAGRKIHVLTLEHGALPTWTAGYKASMYGDTEALELMNGSTSTDELVKQGPYLTLGPGTNLIVFDGWRSAVWDEVDPREQIANADIGTARTVAIDVIPRYWG